MTLQPSPELLSMLQKASNPLKNLTLNFKIKGVFAVSQQWKNTDEANPNIFGYSVQCFSQHFTGGKIQPRKLTEKELKEQEEQKNKKGAKKQAKQQEKPQEEDPEAVRKKLQWQKLSEQEKFFSNSQNPYKAFSIKFSEDKVEMQLGEAQIQKLEKAIDTGYLDLTLIRKPQISDDEIGKLKKSKPKNLNLGELYTATYTGKINVEELAKPGVKEITKRVKVIFHGQPPAECIKIDNDQTYIYIQMSLSSSIFPEVKQVRNSLEGLFPQFKKKSQKKQNSSVEKLKIEIVRAIKAISQQYSLYFSKDRQHQEDKKHSSLGSISTLRMNEINKKKEQFLNQFLNNGKYSILRERISSTLKAICIDKFRKQKSIGPITKSTIEKTLSELNVYFHQQFLLTVDQFMQNQSYCLHQDLVLSHQTSRQSRKQTLAPIFNQTKEQRQLRLANEYEIVNEIQKAQKSYMNLLLMNQEDKKSMEIYAKFCLKNKKFDQAFAVFSKIAQNEPDFEIRLILSLLLVRKRRISTATNLINQMIDESSSIDDKIALNQLLSFMVERENDIKMSQKYIAMAQRLYLVKVNPNMKLNPIKNPYQQPRPKVPKPAHYTSQVSIEQCQQMRLNLIGIFQKYGIHDLVQEFLQKINDCFRKQILQVQVHVFNLRYIEALEIINKLIESSPKNIDLLLRKADICYKADKMFQSEEIFLQLIKLKPSLIQTYLIYVRLGFTYLNRESWQDALTIFQKSCEIKPNSSLSWLGLGIAEAEEALDLANIYNPLDKQCEKYLQKIREIQKKQNQQIYAYAGQSIQTH